MGWMHDYVEQALAAKLNLTEEQVEAQLASDKTMYDIALDNGVKQEDLATFMNDVHTEAFTKAVEDGVMTEEQANWMLQRMQNRGFGTGNCPMHNGQGAPNGVGRGFGPGMMGGHSFQNP
jgi:DNA-directed RNA polymerase sigma subunit (sigma70/sigma32)